MPRVKTADTQLHKATMLIVFVTIFATLYFAQDVFIPLALAILVTFVLTPLANYLERRRCPRVVAAVVVVLTVCVLTLSMVSVVGNQFVQFARDLGNYQTEIVRKINTLQGTGSGFFSRVTNTVSDIKDATEHTGKAAQDSAKKQPEAATQPIGANAGNPLFVSTVDSGLTGYLGIVGQILGPLGTIGLVLVMVLFMLLERDDLRDRLIRLSSSGRYTVTTQALSDATDRISRYLRAQLIVNGTYGIAISVGLYVIGLTFGHGQTFPSFILFGVLCAVLRFIPYVGPWIASTFPLAVSLAVFPGFGVFIAVIAMFVIIELISNNFMEPLLYGSSTGISTVALFVAALLWTFLWGPYGLLMATPLTVCVVVIGQHVPSLSFLDVLLGDKPALPAGDRFYQRLIAGADADAAAVIEEFAKEHGTIAAADEVVMPAIRMARHDRRQDDLSAEEEASLYRIADGVIGIGRDKEKAADPDAAHPVLSAHGPLLIALPAHHRAESIPVALVGDLLQACGARVDPLACSLLPSDVESHIASGNPAAVFIAVLPPGGAMQARYLCRRLRRKFKTLPIVVGYFGTYRDFDALLVRFRAAGASHVTTSVGQSRSQLATVMNLKIAPEVERVQSGPKSQDNAARPAPRPPAMALCSTAVAAKGTS